jgi:NTP pyrophosphatase (non-canonical NTP hydrolase)
MKPWYEPESAEQAIAYLIEECGEVLSAAGKTLRWGLASVNPELPSEQREENRDWLLREMKDLAGAVKRVRSFLKEEDEMADDSRDEPDQEEKAPTGHGNDQTEETPMVEASTSEENEG